MERSGNIHEVHRFEKAIISPVSAPSVWLDGQAPTPTRVGFRGLSYAPGEASGATAAETYNICLCISGESRVWQRTDQMERAHQVTPGGVAVLPTQTEMRWRWEHGLDVLHLDFDARYMREVAQEAFGRSTPIRLRHAVWVADDALAELGNWLVREVSRQPLGAQRSVRALGELIALHLLRHHFEVSVPSREQVFTEEQRERLQRWLDGHLDERLPVERLARLVHLGVDHFARTFRASFGTSPASWVRERRLLRARELLLDTTGPISEIANATGFADQSHLTRHFTRRFGASPGALRRGG